MFLKVVGLKLKFIILVIEFLMIDLKNISHVDVFLFRFELVIFLSSYAYCIDWVKFLLVFNYF